MSYRTTPSSVTGKTPCELFLGRQIQTRFDLMKPVQEKCFVQSPLQDRMQHYVEKMRQRIQGKKRTFVYFFLVTMFWLSIMLGKQNGCSERLYEKLLTGRMSLISGGREVKRHIDDLIPDCSKVDHQDDDDDTWMYVNSDDELPPRTPPPRARVRRQYPCRERRPVDRY